MGSRSVPLTRAVRCERGTAKYVRDATGAQSAVSADVAAIDHDADRRALGVLIEERTENLILRSQDFDILPWKIDPTVTLVSDPATGPDNQTSCFRVTLPGGTDGLYQQVSGLTVGETYTFSVFLRTPGASNVTATIGGLNGTTSETVMVEPGWVRFSHTATASDTSRYPKINLVGGTGPLELQVWGAMLEPGSRATSYVRSLDEIKVRGRDLLIADDLGWLYQGEGTFLVEGTAPPAWGSLTRIVSLHSGDPNDDHLELGYHGPLEEVRLMMRLQQNQLINQATFGGISPGADFRIGVAYRDNDIAVGVNGIVKYPGGGANIVPRNFSTMILGSYKGESEFFNGWVKRVSYWPRRLTDTRLGQVTG